ncbi:MAG: hypothetical protein EOO56_04400 [Hymenobacter sp.]|nr:MAG: hypothetical protein EOO56_04400 [Hymenobacter sp.]
MEQRLTQSEFDAVASAWAAFLNRASPAEVQALFHSGSPESRLYQTSVRFDLTTTITELLSTVGIGRVLVRFVLLPPAGPGEPVPAPPRFRLVLYAADQLGGRISAYYQSDAAWQEIKPKDPADYQGLVPYNLIKNWLNAWVTVATKRQLNAAMFATKYGPLQGYDFELSDFMDSLFPTKSFDNQHLYIRFGLKTYYPAYPEKLKEPVQTFGLVVRLYSPQGSEDMEGSDDTGGPSYDLAQAYPPG